MLSNVLFFLLGLILLVVGAEFFVRGAARLAVRFGISSLVIGLTVVAFGTSAPELSVSLRAGMDGQPDIALGNVVGSNIFNILFILGLSALIVPLRVDRQLVRLDVPLMIAASVLVLLLGWDGRIRRLDGIFLFGDSAEAYFASPPGELSVFASGSFSTTCASAFIARRSTSSAS